MCRAIVTRYGGHCHAKYTFNIVRYETLYKQALITLAKLSWVTIHKKISTWRLTFDTYYSNSTDTNSYTIHHIPKNESVSEIFSLKRFPRVCLPSRTPARSSSRTPTRTLDCPFNNTHACSRLYARPPEFTAFNNKQLLIEIVIEIELVNGKKIEIESNSFFANRNITIGH